MIFAVTAIGARHRASALQWATVLVIWNCLVALLLGRLVMALGVSRKTYSAILNGWAGISLEVATEVAEGDRFI